MSGTEPATPNDSIAGQVALVVGGGSGLGRLAARRWASAGGQVVCADIDPIGIRGTADGHPSIHPFLIDATDALAVAAMVRSVENELGSITRCYNTAAIQPTGLLASQPLEEIHRVMRNNYGAFVNTSLAVLRPMLEREHGVLVNFCSMAGWIPAMHFGAYGATKAASIAFTEVLYHENRRRGVQIHCVCPPVVDTPLVKQATSNPKILDLGPAPLQPSLVLDAVDRAIVKDRFWVYPGFHTRIGLLLRRLAPALLWRINHRTEGF